jgi:hypothetical protein
MIAQDGRRVGTICLLAGLSNEVPQKTLLPVRLRDEREGGAPAGGIRPNPIKLRKAIQTKITDLVQELARASVASRVARHWPALQDWSVQRLPSVAGSLAVPANTASYSASHQRLARQEAAEIPLPASKMSSVLTAQPLRMSCAPR